MALLEPTDTRRTFSPFARATGALDQALARFAPGLPADRPDTPDLHVTAVRRLPAVAAQYAPFPDGLDARLTSALASRGIAQLYTHQAEAIDHALAGRHVVVITPTASGKTLCYNAPVLNAILQDPSSRALYLFPTKALAQDQLAELQATVRDDRRGARASRSACSPTTATRRRTRGARSARARTSCSAIPTWCTRASCRTIRAGRSCSRTCATSSSTSCTPIAACSAATCATCCGGCGASAGTTDRIPCSSARRRRSPTRASWPSGSTEQPFELVDESGAPRGEKFFVFVNPPVVNQQLGIRRSYLGETRRVASEFLKRNLQLIVFAQSRLSTEILTTYLKDDFEGVPGRARADPRLPRRLPAAAPPRDRERAARGRGARGRLDQRARARHRHRRARRRA